MQLLALSIAVVLRAAPPAPDAGRPLVPPAELQALFKRCAPTVAPETMAAVVRVESAANPFAIGVVDGKLERQPQNLEEAVATAEALEKAGRNFSIGLVQVNRYNLARFGLTYRTGFDPCSNLRAGSKLLEECYVRAVGAQHPEPLAAAVSCYYSGTFTRGYQQEPDGQASYVGLVLKRADAPAPGTEAATAVPPASAEKAPPPSAEPQPKKVAPAPAVADSPSPVVF